MNAGRLLPSWRVGVPLAACLVGLLVAGGACAMYAPAALEQVPVTRLVENLEKAIQDHPKDAQLRFNLARVHAMAYAQKSDMITVNKNLKMLAPWFGYEPKFVPFIPKATDNEDRREAARKHLQKAIQTYRKTIELTPNNLAARLGLAWCVEQSGDKKKAVAEYRDVIERGWKKEKDLKFGPLGGHYITAEAGGYLVQLLDAEKDRDEIAGLKQRTAQLRKLPRPITPIAIPLRDGLAARDLLRPTSRVAFDLDGTGLPQHWTWTTKEAGWLVYDPKGRGEITSGLQFFGNVTFWLFWDNGYDALAALDDNGDGMLTGDELKHLAIWHDRNGNGKVEAGEVKSLAEHGIVALSCRHERRPASADCAAFSPRGVVFRDGTTRPSFDLILRAR
jgi:hypothetical protein